MTQDDFEKGFENGLDNIERGNYEGYLSSEVSLEWLNGNKKQILFDLDETKKSIEETKAEKLAILSNKKSNVTLFAEQSHLVEQIEESISDDKNKIARAEKIKENAQTTYPFFAGFLYFLAGVTFIIGDLIISHEIVAYALNIRNNIEAWTFAVGLASVSVLLKPAYERLIEQPYLKNSTEKSQKIHAFFQTFLLVGAISTLSVLGYFRYEAFKTDKIKESINRQIKSLQLDATPIIQNGLATVDPALNQKIEQKMQEYDQMNLKLVNSPWALWSFVLSGVLFAIAGAICLGIAFPIIQVYWQRWFQLSPQKFWAKRRIRKNLKKLNALKKPWFHAKTELDFEDEKINLLPDLTFLADKKTELEQSLTEINEKIKLAMESGRVSVYNEGYESGFSNRNNMSDAEFEIYRKKMLENLSQKRDEADANGIKTYRKNGLRPHQALRKAISDSFNDN